MGYSGQSLALGLLLCGVVPSPMGMAPATAIGTALSMPARRLICQHIDFGSIPGLLSRCINKQCKQHDPRVVKQPFRSVIFREADERLAPVGISSFLENPTDGQPCLNLTRDGHL